MYLKLTIEIFNTLKFLPFQNPSYHDPMLVQRTEWFLQYTYKNWNSGAVLVSCDMCSIMINKMLPCDLEFQLLHDVSQKPGKSFLSYVHIWNFSSLP